MTQIWKAVKENKDLDMRAHKILVATVMCEEIAKEKFSSFVANEEWCQLNRMVQYQHVAEFGRKVSSILDVCLSEYNVETTYFDDGKIFLKQKQLEERLLQLVRPAYQCMLGHICTSILDKYKKAFDGALNSGKGFSVCAREYIECFMSEFGRESADVDIAQANWDSSIVRNELRRDMDSHTLVVRAAKLTVHVTMFEKKLNEALSGPVEALLDGACDDTWLAHIIFSTESLQQISLPAIS